MSMRTVLVLPAWYPTARQPLAGSFVADHVRAAAAQGHQMVVLADEGPSDDVRGLVRLSEGSEHGVRVFRFAYRPRAVRVAGVGAALRVARRLRREGHSVDVLHAHIHRMAWVAVLAGLVLRRPVVMSEHSSEWPRRLLTAAQVRRAKIAFGRAALVCPVNRQLQRAIQAYGIRARFRVVPNTVDTGIFRPAAARGAETGIRLVNVALHVEVKALDVLLHAVALLTDQRPELTLELVGEGPTTPALQELTAELGLEGRVRFAGALAPAEVADRLRASDVFVLSSRSENLPLAVLEALCCGLPVVATSVGGVSEAVGQDGALVPSDDPAELARAVEEVIAHLDRFDRDDIARRGAARWSFAAVGALWDEIYRSLARR